MDWSKIAEAVEAEQAEYRARKWQRFWQVAGDVAAVALVAIFFVVLIFHAMALA